MGLLSFCRYNLFLIRSLLRIVSLPPGKVNLPSPKNPARQSVAAGQEIQPLCVPPN